MLKLLGNKPIILDGAMGTLLKAYGVEYKDIPFCSIENQELLRKIHETYIKAGSEIITTNSFRLNDLVIKDRGYTLEELIKSTVSIAKECSKDNLVAYDIGPLGLDINSDINYEKAKKAYDNIARIIKDLPIDIIFIETMYQLKEAKLAIEALKACNKPIFCSFTFNKDNSLYSGEGIEEVVKEIEPLNIDAIGFNCIPVNQCIPVAEEFLKRTSMPIIAKPNLGMPVAEENNKLHYTIGEEEFLENMLKLEKMGVTYLGGCCGTTPRHIGYISGDRHRRKEN